MIKMYKLTIQRVLLAPVEILESEYRGDAVYLDEVINGYLSEYDEGARQLVKKYNACIRRQKRGDNLTHPYVYAHKGGKLYRLVFTIMVDGPDNYKEVGFPELLE